MAEVTGSVVGAPGRAYVFSLHEVTDVRWDGSELFEAILPSQGQLHNLSFSYLPTPLYGQPMLVTAAELDGDIRCYDVLGDILDPIPPLVGCPLFAATDIDGDGFDDLHLLAGETQPQVVLSGSGTYTAGELGLPQPRWAFPFPDLDLDGYADVVHVDYVYDDRTNPGSDFDCWGWPSEEGCLEAVDSTTRVYTGSPEGYLDVPTVELTHDRVIHWNTLRPIQYDADPELELIGIAVTKAAEPLFDYDGALVLLDMTAPSSLQVLAEGGGAWDEPEGILVLDDEDFDGIDDVVIVLDHGVYLHSSASPELPLWEWTGPSVRDAITHDLDGDGLRDLIVLHDTTVRVFFAPFTYELPVDTGHTGGTGHTGSGGGTGDTGIPRATADTGTVGSMTDTASGTAAGSTDSGATSASGAVCGCQAAPPTALGLLPLLALWSRRRT